MTTFGVHDSLMWGIYDYAEIEQRVAAADELGITALRTDFSWADAEPSTKGQFTQASVNKLDKIVAECSLRGIKVLVNIAETPAWARAGGTLEQNPPTDEADFADFCAWLVGRYGTTIDYELWDEPNSSASFISATPAADYTAMVVAAYTAMKAVESDIVVVAGALLYGDSDFTADCYTEGIEGFFDAWSIHPFNKQQPPSDTSDPDESRIFTTGIENVRGVMFTDNADDKPIWLTAFGWHTPNITFQQQADYITAAVDLIRGYAYIDAAFYFNHADGGIGLLDPIHNYGLRHVDLTEKLAFDAYTAAIADGGSEVLPGDPPVTVVADEPTYPSVCNTTFYPLVGTALEVPIVVSGFQTVGDVKLGLYLKYPDVGDLHIELESPEGTILVIADQDAAGNDSIGVGTDTTQMAIFDDVGDDGSIATWAAATPVVGNIIPANALAAFDGEDPNGTWIVRVSFP